MAKMVPLDKTLDLNTKYRTERDKFLIIRKIGTNVSDEIVVEVKETEVTYIHGDFAPLRVTSSNKLGPFDLKELYVVVPPDTTFQFTSASSGKVRIIGTIGILRPGEGLSADLLTRFDTQRDNHWRYLKDSVSLGTDEVWSADRELTVLETTPRTNEEYTINDIIMAKVTGGTISEGQVGIRLYLDTTPFDIEETESGHLGIDVLNMPYPPSDTNGETPFSLKNYPIVVPGDIKFKVGAINISGGDLTPASGSAWTVEVLMPYRYKRKR